MNTTKTILKIKTRSGRGQSWLGSFNLFVYLSALTQLDKLKNDPRLVYFYFIGYGSLCYVIGYLDEKYGIWLAEQTYNTHDLNEWNRSLMYKVDALRTEIQELKNDRRSLGISRKYKYN